MHNYSLIESPDFQRQEFFKITDTKEKESFELPAFDLFGPIIRLLFSSEVTLSFNKLFAIFEIDRNILSSLLKTNYLRKTSGSFMLTEKATKLKKVIIDFLSFHPSLSIEENDFLIKISNSEEYNVFLHTDFSFQLDTEVLCTRLLANQLLTPQNFNSFLLYWFLQFKLHSIDDKQLSFYLVVAMQTPAKIIDIPQNTIVEQDIPSSESNQIQDYFSEIKNVINEKDDSPQSGQVPIPNPQTQVNTKIEKIIKTDSRSDIRYPDDVKNIIDLINERVHTELTDLSINYPQRPIFLSMKFLNSDTIELINNDLNNLNNLISRNCKLPK